MEVYSPWTVLASVGVNCVLSTFHSWWIEHLFTLLMKNVDFLFSSIENPWIVRSHYQGKSLDSNLSYNNPFFRKLMYNGLAAEQWRTISYIYFRGLLFGQIEGKASGAVRAGSGPDVKMETVMPYCLVPIIPVASFFFSIYILLPSFSNVFWAARLRHSLKVLCDSHP